MRTQTTFTFGACVTEMPLSSSRDVSVSISPRCSWRCAHRGGRRSGAGDRGDVLFLCPPPRIPRLCSPPSNLWGEVWRMQSGHGGQDIWTCLHGNKATVDWQRLQPSSLPSAESQPSSLLPLLPYPLHLYLSACSGPALRAPTRPHGISLSLAPAAPPDPSHAPPPRLLCLANTLCVPSDSPLNF